MGSDSMRGAFILFEGLPPTVIDSQVLTHVRLVRERLGIDMPIISFACSAPIFAQAQAHLKEARRIAGGQVSLFRGVRPGLPGSQLLNRRRLAEALSVEKGLSFLHARTDYASAVAGPLARQLGLPMLWDCRGDSVAEILDRRGPTPAWRQQLLTLRASVARREAQNAGHACTAACFVSSQLRDLMRPWIGNKRSWVVPCLASEDEFFFDQILRQATRARLGIAPEEAVYIYSGGLASYQRFDAVVTKFSGILKRNSLARLMVLTPNEAMARGVMRDLPEDRVLCRRSAHSEVNAYLNAADFGFLLRDRNAVNHVAFPTKFAEYALAGLKIVMKDDPPSCVALAQRLGSFVAYEGWDVPRSADTARAQLADGGRAEIGRLARMDLFSDIYRSLSQQASRVS
jgi:hypothetical protein